MRRRGGSFGERSFYSCRNKEPCDARVVLEPKKNKAAMRGPAIHRPPTTNPNHCVGSLNLIRQLQKAEMNGIKQKNHVISCSPQSSAISGFPRYLHDLKLVDLEGRAESDIGAQTG
jgi:hypothetical protein